jgi:hypothetical protein
MSQHSINKVSLDPYIIVPGHLSENKDVIKIETKNITLYSNFENIFFDSNVFFLSYDKTIYGISNEVKLEFANFYKIYRSYTRTSTPVNSYLYSHDVLVPDITASPTEEIINEMDKGFVRLFDPFSDMHRKNRRKIINKAGLSLIDDNYFVAFRGMTEDFDFENRQKFYEKKLINIFGLLTVCV